MNIRQFLFSKSNKIHHINRYISFIESRKKQGTKQTHNHHILPKAKDMFPEYSNIHIFTWNVCCLTYREHFIAHKILSKIFPNSSQSRCFYYMLNKNGTRTSKEYQRLKEENSHHLVGNSHRLGKKDSDETRSKKSKSQIGKLLGKKIGVGNKSRTGLKDSDETRLKKSLAHIGKKCPNNKGHSKNKGRKYFHNPLTETRKMFSPDDPIPEGFIPGMGSF